MNIRDTASNDPGASTDRRDVLKPGPTGQDLMKCEHLLHEVESIGKIGGWEMDMIARTARWTQGTYDIVELDPGQPVPGPDEYLDYYLPEFQPLVAEAMRALVETGAPFEFEAKARTAKGRIVWWRALGRAMWKDGRCIRAYGTLQDITDRKRVEETLNAVQAQTAAQVRRLHCLFELSRMSQTSSGSLDEILHLSVKLIPFAWPNPQHIGVRLRVDDVLYETGQVRVSEWSVSRPLTVNNQQIGSLEVCLLASIEANSAPFTDEEHRLIRAIAEHFQSVVERKWGEEERAEAAIRRRILIDQSRDGIVVIRQDGSVYETNRQFAEMLGYTPEDVMKLHVWDWEYQFPPDVVRGMIRSIDESGDHFETRHRRKDGSVYDVEISTNAADFGGEKLIFCICRDITARKEAEREREGLQLEILQARKLEAVGSLAAGIAHEINTPIQFVGDNMKFLSGAFQDIATMVETQDRLWLEVLDGHEASDLEPQRVRARNEADWEYLQTEIPLAAEQALDGVHRVATIVQAMRDFAHSDHGSRSFANINSMLESTLTVARNELKHVAEVETQLSPDIPDVECYRDDLNQVFLNLLVNAAHAIGDVVGDGNDGKGTITVATALQDDDIVIRISDTGTGIPESLRDCIFDPFFSTKDVGKGSGQGLAIARRIIVEKHKGSLKFETNEGIGTTFIVRLPKSGATAFGTEEKSPSTQPKSNETVAAPR